VGVALGLAQEVAFDFLGRARVLKAVQVMG
jgi:hypothetical protein